MFGKSRSTGANDESNGMCVIRILIPFHPRDSEIFVFCQKAILKYAVYENLGAQVLQMPFRNSNLTMFLLMPVDCKNFNEMQQALDDFDLQALNGGQFHNVYVELPKFANTVSFELNSVMSYVSVVHIICISYGENGNKNNFFFKQFKV